MQEHQDCQPILLSRDIEGGKHHRECQGMFNVGIPLCTGRLKWFLKEARQGDQFQFYDDMILLVLSSPQFAG